MSLQINQQAPDFKLINTEKKEISLSDYKGKNCLILFFPFAFSGTCTTELCATRDDLTFYNNLDVEVFGISIDSFFVLKKFKEELNLAFELLSDFNKTTAKDYGALYEEFILGTKGVAKRAAFVVNKEGILKYVEVLEDAGKIPNFEAIKETLKNIK